ncbi:MAG: c-type cytochrome [Methylococcaceae bacterium]|nr:c-type cytochrome [Methylococcaceae bacterium]
MKWSFFLAVIILSSCYREPTTLNSTGIDNKIAIQARDSTTKNKVVQPHASTASSFKPRKFSKGEALYINYCADCHGWEGRGNGQAEMYLDVPAPILLRHNLLAEKSENDFVDWVSSGTKMQVQLSKKASLNTDAEVNALLNYIKKIPNIEWNKVKTGQQVYDQLCLGCHGMYGHGKGNLSSKMPDSLPNLSSSSFQAQHSNKELIQIITKGIEAMPGTENILKPQEIESVISFIRLLSPGYESYDRYCQSCHGSNGSPVMMTTLNDEGEDEDIFFQKVDLPVFDNAYFKSQTDKQLISKIQHMLKSERVSMPHFSGFINENEIREIFRYLGGLIEEYP